MAKTVAIALLGISFIGGFVVLEARNGTLSPDEQVARYKANERARSIAHLGYQQSQEFLRERLRRRNVPFHQVVTGRTGGGEYRCAITVDDEQELIASLNIVSSYNGATHQINATVTARADTQLTTSDFEEWYTARHVPEDW